MNNKSFRNRKLHYILMTWMVFLLLSCGNPPRTEETIEESPFIVFVTGDEEYRSEESMPMIASILEREMGARTKVLYAIDSLGFINPNVQDNIPGLEILDSADMMVMFTRFRQLPEDQLLPILRFAESGKPMVGFRTSTHAFAYKDSTLQHMNNEWPTQVFGQQWITHHGHFDDGSQALTSVTVQDTVSYITRGVNDFGAFSWLYHVDGGEWSLYGDSKPLLFGKANKSNHEMNDRLDQFPLTNPVAWTKTHTTETGQKTRVFFTTLGHPFDFKNENMRRLAVQGIYWALGKEESIPQNGINVSFAGVYEPNNSGFGEKFKKGLRPSNEN